MTTGETIYTQKELDKAVREAKYDAYAELFELFPKQRGQIANMLSHNWQITAIEFTSRPMFKRDPLTVQRWDADLPATMRGEKRPYQIAKAAAD